jgi:hypothetical protein
MTITITEALGALQTAIEALLPVPADPALAPVVRIHPLSFQPVGVGGVLSHVLTVPRGALEARRIAAQLVLRVKAANQSGLTAAEATASAALVGADPVGLRSQGIFKLRRTASANPDVEDAAGAGRDVHFDVLFEYRKLPQSDEGVITEILADSFLRSTAAPIHKLFSSEFQSDPLTQFDVRDDPQANGSGAWQYDAQRAELLQVSSMGGGSNDFNADKAGTALVLRPAAVPALARNFVLWASVRSDVGGGIGLVFRYLDPANHYFFLMNTPQPYRLLARKVDSQASFLDSAGRSSAMGYDPDVWNLVRLSVQDQDFEIAINGAVALRGRDAALAQPGSVGFLCRNNSGARFRLLRWLALD